MSERPAESRLDLLAGRYARWLILHARAVVVLSVLASLVLVAGAHRLTTSNDLRAYFSDDNPELSTFEALERRYERQDNLVVMVVARTGDLFTRDGLALVHELTRLGWQVPYSRRVSSLSNHQHTVAVGDALFVADLVPEPGRLDADAIARIKGIALGEPALVGQVVAASGIATGISISLTLPDAALAANDEVIDWMRPRVEALRAANPDFTISLGGTTATDVALGEAVQQDVRTLIGTSYVVIVLGLALLLRHLVGTLATVSVVTLSVAVTMGIFGWAGATLEPTAGFVPSIVMTIGVADSVHLLSTYYYELRRRAGGPAGTDGDQSVRAAAISEALRVNAGPIFITSVTTAIGVLMLNFSDSPPYRELGNMVAVGVMAAWVLSMTFLPALLALTGVRHADRGAHLEAAMAAFTEWLLRHRTAVLVVMTVVVIGLASNIPNNRLGERWHEYFDASFDVRQAIDASAEHLGGVHIIIYDMRGAGPESIHDPRYLAELEAFATWLEAEPGVTHVARITQLLARLNMNLHGDDPAWRRLPESRELAAQLLLLYELSLPLGMGLENSLDVARAGSLLRVIADRMDSEQMRAFDTRAEQWLRDNARHIAVTRGTGLDLVFAHINHRNILSLLNGMVLALVLISILLVVALRSLKLGALSLVTNLAPAGLAYGTWALVDGTIDLSASVVICMSIGIVVDDTVHFLSKYRRARYERGATAETALRYAFNTVGIALTITTAVLVAGFAVLAASHFNPTVTTGTLMAITLAYALLVDFLFLPPLLLLIDGDRRADPRGPARTRPAAEIRSMLRAAPSTDAAPATEENQ